MVHLKRSIGDSHKSQNEKEYYPEPDIRKNNF